MKIEYSWKVHDSINQFMRGLDEGEGVDEFVTNVRRLMSEHTSMVSSLENYRAALRDYIN